MHDDATIDRLLSDALGAAVPSLSPDFDTRVMRRVRPRRLMPAGRAIVGAYAVFAVAAAAWLMRDLSPLAIGVAVMAVLPVAAGSTAYQRRLSGGL